MHSGISILVETEATMIAQLQDNLGRFVGALGEVGGLSLSL